METPNTCMEPRLQRQSLSSLWQNENPESQFTENHRVNGDLCFMCLKPLDRAWVWNPLGRFTEDVGVHQVLHSASVDSESIGTKKSLLGQANSQSTAPSFGGVARRTRR